MDLPKLSIQPILDARADRMDPAWEAAMGSRQHLKHSYAMDAWAAKLSRLYNRAFW